jgi:predicted MPP superfamily phosphohydrolase
MEQSCCLLIQFSFTFDPFKQWNNFMKTTSFIVFFSIVLTIYALVNFYIFRRVWPGLSDTGIYRSLFLYIFIFLVLAYPIGRFAESITRNIFTDFLVIVGSFYLGMMVYAFLIIMIIDVFRLLNHFLSIFPAFLTRNPPKTTHLVTLGSIILVLLIVFFGYLNTLFLRVREFPVDIQKSANGLKELKIVVVSDVHLGTVIRSSRLEKIVAKINSLQPDIVLLPGDIVDEDVNSVAEQNMAKILKKLDSKFGVFACSGNHEYFGGVEAAVSYMSQGGITVLQDSVVKVADAFYVAGRKDLMSERMADGRKSLDWILRDVDHSLPIIVMDHQPYHLKVVQQNGVDLQLSGHTHHGQLFPFNFITRLIYDLSWGYSKIENTHYYVSCGVGTWGPPVRTSSYPEIVLLNLKFTK